MYQFIRLRYSLSLCFILGVLVSGCGSEKIWEVDKDIFEESLREGSYTYLADLSFEEADPDEIHRLGPGSATAMALVFTRIGRAEIADRMLRSEWEKGQEPWRRDAGFALAERCLDREEYLRCLHVAEELAEEYGSYRAYRLLLETRYWLLENETALDILRELRERFPDDAAADDELLLFEAAVLSRLEREGWRSSFIRLFLEVPAGEFHIRALDYLRLSGLFPGEFGSPEQDLFEMKYSLAAGLYREGTDRASAFLAGTDGGRTGVPATPGLLNEVVLEDITLLYLLAGKPLDGYRLLAPLFEPIETPEGNRDGSLGTVSRVKLSEVTGRLLRRAGLYTEAIGRFDEGLEAAGIGGGPSGSDSGTPGGVPAAGGGAAGSRMVDRILWFRADCYFELGAERLVRHLPELVAGWNNPDYFSDLLDELGTALAASGRWDLVREAWSSIRGRGAEEATARLAYILLRTSGSGSLGSGDAGILAADALRPEAGAYYPVVAGVLTGRDFDIPEGSRKTGGNQEPAVIGDAGELPHGSVRVIKLMEFGLLLEAFDEARREKVGRPLFLELGRRLEEKGFYREAVLCGAAAVETASRADLERIYPRYFADLVDELVAEYPVPRPLIYALIREESYFDSRIVSRAGAVGLTQLMPATAAEMARRLDIEEYDVLDPGTNLYFGGYYFYTLLNRFSTAVHALSAYNAGPTRVRRWERSFGSLPTDIFLEAIPFRETRNHCRKVLVSAVHYGYLYEDLEPGEVVGTFFPEFME